MPAASHLTRLRHSALQMTPGVIKAQRGLGSPHHNICMLRWGPHYLRNAALVSLGTPTRRKIIAIAIPYFSSIAPSLCKHSPLLCY